MLKILGSPKKITGKMNTISNSQIQKTFNDKTK